MSKINTEMVTKLIEKSIENNTEVIKIGEIDGRNINIEIKKTLNIEEFYSVCAALSIPPIVKPDDGINIYVPSGEVTGFKVALIRAYVPDFKLPDDVVEAYQICSKLNLFHVVHNALKDTDMYSDLWLIAERYSEYHRLMNSGLSTIESIMSKTDMGEMMEKILPGFFEKVQSVIPPNVTDSENA